MSNPTAPGPQRAKTPVPLPTTTTNSTAGTTGPSGSSRARIPAKDTPSITAAAQQPKTVVIPPVPSNSWYASPFTEASNQPLSAFHAAHRGQVCFSNKVIPVRAAELDALPDRAPATGKFFDIGKELIFGVGYLHNTALYTEHRWRGRVSHLQAVKDGMAEVPESIRKVSALLQQRETTAAAAALPGETKDSTAGEASVADPGRKKTKRGVMPTSAGAATRPGAARGSVSSSTIGAGTGEDGSGAPSPAPAPPPVKEDRRGSGSSRSTGHASHNTGANGGIMNLTRTEATIYQHPFFDMLLGLKVHVNDELVADHYPGVRSLPQCTTTIDTADAVSNWNCVPFVLMGYLNHVTLETIDLYRTLSLSFVEHLLRIKFPVITTTTEAAAAAAAAKLKEETGKAGTAAGDGAASNRRSPAVSVAPGTRVMELKLRVEVVYGCRSEAFYCTDFIARGSCTLFLAETAKPALKSYEEKLRALVMARRSSEQIIRAPTERLNSSGGGPVAPARTCQSCGNLLLFRCTVCGAEFCGSLMCSRRPLPGYPCGCTAHKAMLT